MFIKVIYLKQVIFQKANKKRGTLWQFIGGTRCRWWRRM